MGLPALVAGTGAALYEAAPLIKAAVSKVPLPAISAGTAVQRAGIIARLEAAYNSLPGAAKSVITGVVVGLGVHGVSSAIEALTHAKKDQATYGMLMLNLAQAGVNPDDLVPPEYAAKMSKDDRALFDNARASFAAFVASHGSQGTSAPRDAMDDASVHIEGMKLIRTISDMFGARTPGELVQIRTSLKRFLDLDPGEIGTIAVAIRAAGGRL